MTLPVAAGLATGLVLLVVGAELLVRGASRLAARFGLSPLVIGLTVVAFGTSAPEFAVSVGGAVTGAVEIAVGNVVGSNVFNLLAVLGASAVAGALTVHRRVVRIDAPVLVVVTAGVWVLAGNGVIGRLEGVGLLLALIAYTSWLYRASRRESAEVADDVAATSQPRAGPATVATLAGLAVLLAGAHLLVGAAVVLAASLGVSELVIGLTVVAGGTSLPELATSVVAALRGQRDIAVGNLIGSNLFNLLGVLGAAATVAPGGIAVSSEVLAWDLPVALAVTLVAPLALATGLVVARWEGVLLVACYAAYALTVVLLGVGSPLAGWARGALLAALAVVAVVIFLVGWRVRRRRGSALR